MVKRSLSLIILTFSLIGVAQEKEKQDTIIRAELPQLVYTGQVSPQKINRSVYEVRVITGEQIEQSGANNLADILNQSLNIQIIPNNSTGKSGLKLFGLNSEYVKVLMDNVPIINDEGLGSYTDFTQINLNDIEQIEIVEGAMGVDYGADAVAGVINIITKKSAKDKVSADIYIQEETLGNEYNYANKGRHIIGTSIRGRILPKWTWGMSFDSNDFKGWYDNKKGKKHRENDGLRGYAWLPKQQYNAKAFTALKVGKQRISYQFNYFEEEVNRYNELVLLNSQPQTNTTHPTAQDRTFGTKRFSHLLSVNGSFAPTTSYNINLSYQKQDRERDLYKYDILNDSRSEEKSLLYESRSALYSKGMFQKDFIGAGINWQLGYEINEIQGKQSPDARGVDNSGKFIDRKVGTYDVFTSADVRFNDRLTFRPGVRSMFSSQFKTTVSYSLSLSYLLNNGWSLRGVYSTVPKAPTYDQLFTYFVDTNHDVQGNENLKPETGQSIRLHIKKKTDFSNGIHISQRVSGWYLNLKDKIDLITLEEQPLRLGYANADTYTNQGVSLDNELNAGNLRTSLGVSYAGEAYESDGKDMLYALQGNFSLGYHFPKANIYLNTMYKYNGAQYRWKSDPNSNELVKGKQDAYSLWDASIRKTFFKKLDMTVGVRNLANVKQVNTTAAAAGAHTAAVSNMTLGYGRSFFLRLNYQISIN